MKIYKCENDCAPMFDNEEGPTAKSTSFLHRIDSIGENRRSEQ